MTNQIDHTPGRSVGIAEQEPWLCCPQCRALVYRKRFERLLRVCPECGGHDRLAASERVEQLLDPGSRTGILVPQTVDDPLGFVDFRDYSDRLAECRARSGGQDAVLAVTGKIGGHPVVMAVLDFGFLGGSLGVAAGEAVTVAAERALQDGLPLVIVTASGGARMQEGALSLMQMVKTSNAMAALDEAGILTVTLITDPTYGGVAASFATLSDVVLAEPGARMGFAGPRVIRQTIGEELPEGFQTAEFLAERGLIDGVHARSQLRGVLTSLLNATGPACAAVPETDTPTGEWLVTDPGELTEIPAWEAVQRARHGERPTTLEHINTWCEGFVELRGSRCGTDSPALVGGIGVLAGRGVLILGHQKGHDTPELVRRKFGMADAEGYRKARRLMRLAAKLGLSVVTLIDTPGAHPGVESEETGQAASIARCIAEVGGLPVPVISVITGEGGSGGALALAAGDRVFISENAVYSVISPEGCASILWKSPSEAALAAEALQVDARSLLRHGIVDGVVREPGAGAHEEPHVASARLYETVRAAMDELADVSPAELVRRRRERFRGFGRISTATTYGGTS